MEEQSLQSYFPSENYHISVNSVSETTRTNQPSAAQSRSEQQHVEYGYFTPGEIQTGIFVQMDETTRSH